MLNSPKWEKSSYSDIGISCIEIFQSHANDNYEEDKWHIRDSKNPDGPVLIFNKDEWKSFILGVKAGEFDIDHIRAHEETPDTRPEVPDLSMTSDTELKFIASEGYPARPSVPESHDG